MLEVGGFEPFSTTDWPGALAAVVFVQGCPWRCSYCHNPALQPRRPGLARVDWRAVRGVLERRRGLLDGVVFSGGEPTIDPRLPEAVDEVRALGFAVGLHTAGIHVKALTRLLPRLAWIGFDYKAPVDGHDALTGVRGSAAVAERALDAVAGSGVPFEVRTTTSPAWHGGDALVAMARRLHAAGVARWVLQRARTMAADGSAPVATAPAPPADVLRAIAAEGMHVELR